MKLFLKIIMFIPIVNYISFFLFAIPIQLTNNRGWLYNFKRFMLIAFGFVFFGMIRALCMFLPEVANHVIKVITLYLQGLHIAIVAYRSIPTK